MHEIIKHVKMLLQPGAPLCCMKNYIGTSIVQNNNYVLYSSQVIVHCMQLWCN